MKVAIIGGGPSGLAVLKYFLTAHEYFDGIEPIEAWLFEQEGDIGGTFRYRTYPDSELVSSKYLTAFSDHRLPADAPDFLTPEEYLKYLDEYVDKFDLAAHIDYDTRVVKIRKTPQGRHIVTLRRKPFEWLLNEVEDDWEFDVVAVCSGLNVTPNMPDIPGMRMNDATFNLIHSSVYRGSNHFNGAQKVVILGAGETAMDISYQAVNHPDVKQVVMCNRDGFLVAPKITPEPIILRTWGKPYPGKRPNKPIDTTIASLFDTMYVPPLLQRGPLLWLFYDRWIKYIFFLIAGTTQGIDQWVGGLPPRRRYADAIFLVKSDNAVPYMSAGQRKGFWNAVRSFFINVPIKDTGDRRIEVKGWPSHVDEVDNLHIPEPSSEQPYIINPDRVIFATGYRTSFPFLQEGHYPTLEQATVRGIYRDISEGFAYIGFVRPSIGAIPPLAELQAQMWVYRTLAHRNPRMTRRNPIHRTNDGENASLLAHCPKESVIAPYELDYALHARGSYDLFSTKRGVDHDSYAFQLALDMGAAPTFSHMVKHTNWRCLYTWAMGPNFNTKFRLAGPWARPDVAIPILDGELFSVVKRSGGYFFFATYTLLPFVVFGLLSLTITGATSVFGYTKCALKYVARKFRRNRNRNDGPNGVADGGPIRLGPDPRAIRIVEYF